MEHKLSIIIPLFNSGKHICRCLESILELPMHKEVIVVDDGSTDSSHSLALKYAERGDIRLFSQENKGVSEARNLGLDNASGDIIAFVDSDDYILGDGFLSLYGRSQNRIPRQPHRNKTSPQNDDWQNPQRVPMFCQSHEKQHFHASGVLLSVQKIVYRQLPAAVLP